MKEIVKVSLSGISFVFEHDAYSEMRKYLDKIVEGYANNPDGKEIISDIESRIVELVLERQDSATVVTQEMVVDIIAQMGYPEDMQDETEIKMSENFPRRLYRNMENGKLGGVCSGLATYFDVETAWIRVGFFMPIVGAIISESIGWSGQFFGSLWGVFVLLYFILWISIPRVKTARQKLEMRGEKINANTIHTTFAEETAAKTNSPKAQRSANVWADIAYGFGRLILFAVKVFLFFIVFVCGITVLGLLISLGALLMGAGDSFAVLGPLDALEGVFIGGISPVGFVALVLLAIALFIFIVGFCLIRIIFNIPSGKKGLSIVSIIFIIIFIFVCAIGVRNIGNWDAIEERIEWIDEAEWGGDDDDWDGWNLWHEWDTVENVEEFLNESDIDSEIITRVQTALTQERDVSIWVDDSDEDSKVVIEIDDDVIYANYGDGVKSVRVRINENN